MSTSDTSITISNIFPTKNSDTTTSISFTIVNILNPPSTAPLVRIIFFKLLLSPDTSSPQVEVTIK